MREYMRLKRQKEVDKEPEFTDYNYYKSLLSKNKEALKRYKIIKRNIQWII
jgi:glutathione peroxidase-family protein